MTTPDLCEKLETLAQWFDSRANRVDFSEFDRRGQVESAALIRQALSLLRREGMEEAIKDVNRLDMLKQHGIDWDGQSIYYRGKTISCNSIREGLDKFKDMNKEPE